MIAVGVRDEQTAVTKRSIGAAALNGPVRTAIWWLRRDLRLQDNQALLAAAQQAEWVVPLFVIDPALVNDPCTAPQRLAFLYAALRSLASDLQVLGSQLIVRIGQPAVEVSAVARHYEAVGVFAEEDWWPYGRQRDQDVAAAVALHLCGGLTVVHPAAITKPDGRPYTVYSPFRRAWLAQAWPLMAEGPASNSLAQVQAALAARQSTAVPPMATSSGIPDRPAFHFAAAFPASEAQAQARLEHFAGCSASARMVDQVSAGERAATTCQEPVAPISRYAGLRDRLDVEATSQLSPQLRFGLISARQAAVVARRAAESAADEVARASAWAWLDELIWREFYQYILYWFPEVLERSFRPELAAVRWREDESASAAWAAGQTGYPIVDAAMRALVTTGWLHNRGRMIVASFLTKDLLLDWRHGERFFMRHLLDGDPAANNGGWQWTAGTGTDAAPYFRVFSPVRQGQRYDPQGAYVRRFVPELRHVPPEYVHTPWLMPNGLQKQVACVVGRDYPEPIVDHDQARLRALEAYREARVRSSRQEVPHAEDA